MSLPPPVRKTIRCAESSAEISTVSSPSEPFTRIVLMRRLVPAKLPMGVTVSAPGPVLTMISSIPASSAITLALLVPLRVITISVAAASGAPGLATRKSALA